MWCPKNIEGKILDYLNVGTEIDISIKELAFLIAKIVNFKGQINWTNLNLTVLKNN